MRFALLVMVFVACGRSATQSYVDQAGRHCTTKDGLAICDQPPAPSQGCSGSYATPCWWVVSGWPDAGISTMGNCASCCQTEAGASYSRREDCTPIVCQTLDDCPQPASQCLSGVCVFVTN